MSQRTSILEFWNWFDANRAVLKLLTDTADPLWDAVLEKLQRIHDALWFELSHPDGEEREFIVTTEGRVDAFPVAELVIAEAPKIAGWRFIALKPSMGFGFVTRYEDVEFDPRSMWFLPLESEARPGELGLRVGVPNFAEAERRKARNAVHVILDTGLGERSAALDVQHLEVVPLPAEPDAKGFIELPELPAYLAWRKRKR